MTENENTTLLGKWNHYFKPNVHVIVVEEYPIEGYVNVIVMRDGEPLYGGVPQFMSRIKLLSEYIQQHTKM